MNKTMKRILISAALLCAATALLPAFLSAPAFGQTVRCGACTHDVSYFKGKGGLIAKASKEVTWVAQCGGVVRSGKLMPEDGIVATLFDDDNNLACATDGGAFQLGPIDDGGWFWITDDENSAVGNLVNKNILGNATTTLANAGPGIETAAGKGATFVKETATGRVGILPNILPVTPVPPTRKCGFTGTPAFGGKTSSQRRVATNCKLGDGKVILQWNGPVGPGGSSAPLPNNTIVRPYSGGVDVFAALYMNGTGHFVTDPNGDPDLGWVGGTCLGGSLDDNNRCGDFRSGSLVALPGVGGGWFEIRTRNPNAYGARISSSKWGYTISRAGAGTYCGTPEAPKNNTMEITTTMGLVTDASRKRVTPPVRETIPPVPGSPLTSLRAAIAKLRVICPSSPEAQALREAGLMPESLFRTE